MHFASESTHLRQRKTRTICEAERLSRRLTMGANKPVAPASLLQVGGAGRVVGKKSLELWERLWEPKIATLVNVHEHGRTLPLVAVGDNRIGKEFTFRFNRRFYPFNAFRSLLGIAGDVTAPTYAELYSGAWQHPTCWGCG